MGVVLYTKKLHLVSQNWRRENKFCIMCNDIMCVIRSLYSCSVLMIVVY